MFQPSKVVQDFFHPQEVVIFAGILFPVRAFEVKGTWKTTEGG
jgi:hypothetical protein